MSNTSKKIVSIIGIVIGVIIIIIGFSLQDTSNYSIGKSIKFGADFYTEMYDVTKDVGSAINSAINDLICAISWLIISLGAIDICFFVYKLVKASEVSAIEVKAKVQAEQNTKYEPELNSRKPNQCECGEMFYGMYCPVCGKKSGKQSVHVVNSTPQTPQNSSKKCACGERFYGEICPTCGRRA